MSETGRPEAIPILLAEDDGLLADAIKEFLTRRGLQVQMAGTCREARRILESQTIHVALVDKKLPDGEGTAISEYILENGLGTKMILMTAYGPDQDVRRYIQKGAFDFLEKPFDLNKLWKRIENASRLYRLEYTHEVLEDVQRSAIQLIGSSPGIDGIRQQIAMVAPVDSPVLVEGETGTGKELVARNIYIQSKRSKQQFISVNCASIPENLFESEFFGYEKGAFTGAYQRKPGFFEVANFGVLHLDEIGEMPLEFQAKLLRVLEEGSFIKLGSPREHTVDVRLIASTNKNLRREVKEGRFREDLYYRIAVFTISIPPLRERREDIPLIAAHLWRELNIKMGRKQTDPPFDLNELQRHPWPGNVRELRNYLEKLLIYPQSAAPPESISAIPASNGEQDRTTVPLDRYIREYVLETLKRNDYNKTRTARLLGISLSTLKRKLNRWGVVIEKSLAGRS